MKKKFLLRSLASLMLLSVLFTSCNDDDDSITSPNSNSNLTLNISGLKDLGTNYRYEGWIVLDPTNPPISIGTFTVNASGVMSETVFTVEPSNLAAATKVLVSIEPTVDSNAGISPSILLTGNFTNNTASLTVKNGQYVVNGIFEDNLPLLVNINFNNSAGDYMLATPTDGPNTNEKSGIWFAQYLGTPLPNLSFPNGGLRLPTITIINSDPVGWKYEGWVEINGRLLSTGKFDGNITTIENGIRVLDAFSGFSGTGFTPQVPGEDFLLNAPTGLTFPTDLSGAKTFVTLEPNPDNSPEPFFVKPLSATIPTNAVAGTIYNMTNVFSTNTATGTATR